MGQTTTPNRFRYLAAVWLVVFVVMILLVSGPGERVRNLSIFLPLAVLGIAAGEAVRRLRVRRGRHRP